MYVRMITRSAIAAIIPAMDSLQAKRHLLLVTDRRSQSDASPAAGVRRYRLARLPWERRLPVTFPVCRSA